MRTCVAKTMKCLTEYHVPIQLKGRILSRIAQLKLVAHKYQSKKKNYRLSSITQKNWGTKQNIHERVYQSKKRHIQSIVFCLHFNVATYAKAIFAKTLHAWPSNFFLSPTKLIKKPAHASANNEIFILASEIVLILFIRSKRVNFLHIVEF